MLTHDKNEEVELSTVNGRHFLHVPAGRGEEFRIHLASHGIGASVSRLAEAPFDRLELEEGVDPEQVRTILEHWQR